MTLKETLRRDLAHVLAQRPDLTAVKIADAGGDNWEYLSSLPEGPEVLDFFHATEHLAHALASVYGDGSLQTRHRFEELREFGNDCLLSRKVRRPSTRASPISGANTRKQDNQTILRELKYFRKNKARIRYAECKQAGLMIGSGSSSGLQDARGPTAEAERHGLERPRRAGHPHDARLGPERTIRQSLSVGRVHLSMRCLCAQQRHRPKIPDR